MGTQLTEIKWLLVIWTCEKALFFLYTYVLFHGMQQTGAADKKLSLKPLLALTEICPVTGIY